MKRILLLLLLFSTSLFAQTGIGTTTPNASAKLDVYSTNKGFLPPRVTLTSTSDASTIASPAEGLLVYNLGSVGLQAGYYYWNGANWATIATATSAGNGVTASDMVKLYGEAYSSASGKIGNSTTGYSFTVPVSGRYMFDFSSITYGSTSFTINFYVRQGSTNMGSDGQVSTNNGVRVEYNGKVEVNLQSGVTYNVYISSNNVNRGSEDYDRVYYKQVAGNLPVTGQSVDYGIARYSGSDTGAMTAGALIAFDASAAGNLTWSGNKFTLKANKTFELESSIAIYQSAGGVAGRFQIYDYTNSVALATGLFISINGAGTNNPSGNSPMKAIVTPATDIQVGIRLFDYYGPGGPGIIGSTSVLGGYAAPNSSYFLAQQIGSSAFVNPWILSGDKTYNTTGNVGIGTNAPTSTLEVNGSVKASTLSLINSTIGTPSLVLKNGDAASSYSDIAQLKMGWSGSAAGKSQYAHFIHTRHNAGAYGNAMDFYLSNGTADNTIASGSTLAMTLTSPGEISIPGTMTSSGYVTTSDSRLKTNIVNISNALDTLSLLRPVQYLKKYNLPESNYRKKELGFIAQEVQQVLPYLVTEGNDKDKLLSLDYISLIPLLTKAIQEQEIKFKKLNQERDLLEKRMQIIQRRLLKLEKKK